MSPNENIIASQKVVIAQLEQLLGIKEKRILELEEINRQHKEINGQLKMENYHLKKKCDQGFQS